MGRSCTGVIFDSGRIDYWRASVPVEGLLNEMKETAPGPTRTLSRTVASWICLGILLIGGAFPPISSSDELRAELRADRAVLNTLFGEETLRGNAVEVCFRSKKFSAELQFQTLQRWVLPGDGHAFRIGGSIRRPEGPSPIVASQGVLPLAAYPESHWILSPARELVTVAIKLRRLEGLRTRIESTSVSTDSQRADRVTLLTLVDIAAERRSAVVDRLKARFAWQRSPLNPGAVDQAWSDLIVLWSVLENSKLADLVPEDCFGAFEGLQEHQPNIELDVLYDYLYLLRGYTRTLRSNPSQRPVPARFDVFSRFDARTHSHGRPLARFRFDGERTTKLSGHEMDHLAFRGAVSGPFEVGCEAATLPGAFSELLVQGIAASPVHGGRQIRLSGFAKDERQLILDSPLETIESASHLRVVSDGRTATHFFNGRPIHERSATASSVPWVSLRSWRRTDADLGNIHVTGSLPVIDSVHLVSDPAIDGWCSYFDTDAFAGDDQWRVISGEDQQRHLVSEKDGSSANTFHETLLYYVRPIRWDAEISYEFLYDPGSTMVHPAIGHDALLIRPERIGVHRITDGRQDRSRLRPDNFKLLSDTTTSDDRHPGLRNGWNHAAVCFEKDTLKLTLNGEVAATLQLLPGQSRTFGFFHYRDQTRAVVRNVVLTGDWPQRLPSMENQPLALPLITTLNEAADRLPDQLVHRFASGLPPEQFDVDGDETSLIQTSDGLKLTRTQKGGVRSLRLCAVVEGDFDVVASYCDLKISTAPATWHCGIGLEAVLDNVTLDQCMAYRRRDRMQGRHYVGSGQKETDRGGKTTWTGGTNWVDESTSGKLRLVRQGTTMYALHALGDSTAFRLLRTTTVNAGPVGIHGLRLFTEAGKGMSTEAVWTELFVRAERIDKLQPEDRSATLAMLNASRQQQGDHTLTLSEEAFRSDGLGLIGDTDDVDFNAGGIAVTTRGAATAENVRLVKQIDPRNDFDVQIDFDVEQLESNADSRRSGEVVLQIIFDSDTNAAEQTANQVHEASIILRQKWTGTLDIRPRIVARSRGGKTLYLPIRTLPVEMADQFRIVCHDQILYFLFRDQSSQQIVVAATYPLPHAVQSDAVCLAVIAADQCTSKVVWKTLQWSGSPSSAPARNDLETNR